MRKTTVLYFFPVVLFLVAGCGGNALSKKEAQRLLGQKYPRPIDVFIYAGDPKYAKQLQDAGLDREGYVTIKKTKQFGDTTGWLSFTGKATPYFLATPESDQKDLVQKIKAGEEQLAEIIAVQEDEQASTAEISYTTKISTTPFGKLIKLKDGDIKQRKTYLIRYNEEWRFKDPGVK